MRAEPTFAQPAPGRYRAGSLVALGALATLLVYAFARTTLSAPSATPWRELPQIDQLIVVLAVYPIKLAYMLLAARIAALAWRQTAPGLVALRWSMIFFLIGELACWVNIVAFVEEDLLLEYVHSGGMVASLGFLIWAALEAADREVVHYSAPKARCALVGVCRSCAKASRRPCTIERLFQWGLPLLMVLTLMPLSVTIAPVAYSTQIFGVPRTLIHSAAIQWYELRYVPLASLTLMAVAWGLSLRPRRPFGLSTASKILLSASLGHLGFAFLRLACFAFYRDNLVWFVFWEECTELLLIVAVLAGLRLLCPGLGRPTALRHNAEPQ